jgi:hypothetical protein
LGITERENLEIKKHEHTFFRIRGGDKVEGIEEIAIRLLNQFIEK